MDTEKCKVLLDILSSGSISASARRLGYTVGGVSRMMAALEAETGFPLLIRGRNGIKPTKECSALIPVMRELTGAADKYRQMCAEMQGFATGSVTIGVCYDAYYGWLAGLIGGFTKKYPAIQINTVYDIASTKMLSQLNDNSVDICLISRRDGVKNWLSIHSDELMAVIPAENALAKHDRLPLAALENVPFVEISPGSDTDNSRMLSKYGIHPDVRFTCSSINATFVMVSAGLGITLSNALFAQSAPENLHFIPLDPPQYIDVGIAMHDENEMSPAVKRFVKYLRQHTNSADASNI